jgi:uncharacterized Fe-S center protein
MPSEVYYARLADGAAPALQAEALGRAVEAARFMQKLRQKDMVAVKVHVGENKNTTHVRPELAARVVAMVKRARAEAFLTDTSTLYRGQRENGIRHAMLVDKQGFGINRVGAPFLPLDGLCGQHEVEVEVNGELNRTVKIAGDVLLADALVAISHVTGHIVSGLGAAIKNLGMGMASRAGKMRQHSTVTPSVIADRCQNCGKCLRWCPEDAIEERDGTTCILPDRCIGCGQCLAVCRYGAVRFNWGSESPALQKSMAEHAAGVLGHFKDRALFANVLVDMTAECDCMGKVQKKGVPDLGILVSGDLVAVDRASLDLTARDGGTDLGRRFYPELDGAIQIEHAQKMGLGNQRYRLLEV